MMMDRNREAGRRGSMAAVNGALSRRRQRTASSSLRDSPEDDGGMDLQEPGRLRDRGSKKDRDRDRSSRSKRRRGDRLLHGSSNREEGEDSSDDSMDDDDDDDEDDNTSNNHSQHHHSHSHSHHHPSPPSTSASHQRQQQVQSSVLVPMPSASSQMQSSTSSAIGQQQQQQQQAANSTAHHHGGGSSSNHGHQQQQQHRKSLPAKVVRAPPVWKVADEMIGVSIPRKARSASAKRSHECWISGSGAAGTNGGGSGGGGGGGAGGAAGGNAAAGAGEPMVVHRQASTSPARPSPPAPPLPPASTTPISPSSSTASVRKKMKPLSGGGSGNKLRPPKNSKPPSSVQDIEFEVAEVLFGMTRQFPSKPESTTNIKAENGTCNDAKSRVSSPNSVSQSGAVAAAPAAASTPTIQSSPALAPPPNSNSTSGPAVVAPKRKRPRPVKMEDDSASSQSNPPPVAVAPAPASSTSKPDVEKTSPLELPPPSKLEKDISVSSPLVENGPQQLPIAEPSPSQKPAPAPVPNEIQQEPPAKLELEPAPPVSQPSSVQQQEPSETKDETVSISRQSSKVELDMNCHEASTTKDSGRFESPKGEKFKIDLMAPPPGKSSPEADAEADFIMSTDLKMGEEAEISTRVVTEEKPGRKPKLEIGESVGAEKPAEKSLLPELDSKKRPAADLSLDGGDSKLDKSVHSTNKQPPTKQQHQPKVPKIEAKPDTKVQAGSIPLLAGWPGLPTFGYMPSLPAAFTMDVNAGSSKVPQFPSPQLRLKRCATHCYIAQNICYHQQIMKMQQFWPPAPGAAPVFGGKPPYNLNVMPPPLESIMGANPMQQGGAVAVRNMGPSTTSLQQDKQQGGAGGGAGPGPGGGPATVACFSGNPSSKDMNPVAANAFLDTFQQKQPASQPSSSQAPSTSNMLHGPALFFPLGQQQPAAAAAAVAAPSTVIWSGAMKPGGGSGATNTTAPTSISPAPATASSAAGAPPPPPPPPPAATTVSFNYGNLPPPGEAQYLAILQNNAYPYPIPAHIGGPPPQYRGSHAHPMPFFNGSFYASHLFPASQIPHQAHAQQQQQQQQQQSHAAAAAAAAAQQGHQNASTSTGSTSSQKHAQQNRVSGGAASTSAPGAGSHVLLTNMKSAQQQQQQPHRSKHEGETGPEDHPPTLNPRGGGAGAMSSSSQGQKAVIAPNFSAVSVHPQDLALMNAGEKNNNNAPQQSLKMELPHSQAFAMSFPPYGAGPAAIDFASLAQNHSLFQNLPEAAARQYQYVAAAAAAAQAAASQQQQQHHQQQQQKKAHGSMVVDDGKSGGGGGAAGGETHADEEKKGTPGSGKRHPSPSGFPTHSLGHHPVGDNDSPAGMSNILSNSVIESSAAGCNLNLIPATVQGGRVVSNRGPPPTSMPPGSSTSSSSVAASGTTNGLSPQQQQQIAQFQQMRQQQQQQQQQQAAQHMQHQLNSRPKSAAPGGHSSSSSMGGGGFADHHFLSGSAMAKFPNAAATIAGFPQGIVQSNGPNQSPQWKNMGRPASAVPSPVSSGKSHQQQQQQQSSRAGAASHAQQQQQQQALSSMNHQTQISFGSNSLKLPVASGQQIVVGGGGPGGGNPSTATGSVVAAPVGSPQTTSLLNNSKSNAAGSPRSSSSSMKTGPPSSKVSQQMQQQAVASKSSPSSSTHSKSSPVNNRNAPSILGHPNNTTPPPSSQGSSAANKAQQQQQQQHHAQQMQKHQFPAPSQLFFSAPYMQQAAATPSTHQANMSAAAAAYYQRRPADQAQQSQGGGKPSSSTGMLSLSSHPAISLASATVTTDPAKAIAVAAAANNVKIATAAAAAQYAVSAQSAAAGSHPSLVFPYIHIPSVSVKQAAGDQNPGSGNDSLHSCWQPEKR